MNGLLDKFGGVFVKDKFEAEFKNAVKRQGFSISAKKNNDIYVLTNGTASFEVDTAKAREIYQNNHSHEELDSFLKIVAKECEMENRMVSFTNGQAFLRFVVIRQDEIQDDMIYTDFVEGIKKVIVYTSDDINLHFLKEIAARKWAVPREVLFSVADRNMCKMLEKAEINQSEIAGVRVLEFNLESKRLVVSLMMCNDFRRVVHKYMGSKFLVIAPSTESLLILENITNNILEGLGNVIVNEYRKAEYPLTTDVMLFTNDNIQIAGRFSVSDESELSNAGKGI